MHGLGEQHPRNLLLSCHWFCWEIRRCWVFLSMSRSFPSRFATESRVNSFSSHFNFLWQMMHFAPSCTTFHPSLLKIYFSPNSRSLSRAFLTPPSLSFLFIQYNELPLLYIRYRFVVCFWFQERQKRVIVLKVLNNEEWGGLGSNTLCWVVLGLSQDGVFTELFENLSVNSKARPIDWYNF